MRSGLAAREAAYYRVLIPSNTPSWQVKLTAISGEALLLILKDHVPNVDCGRFFAATGGKFMQKAGNEHYVLLPNASQTNLTPGAYFLAVVGEGLNPASSLRVGGDSSSYILTSVGTASVNNFGTLGQADLLEQDALEGGECRFYQFSVLTNTAALELRLEDRVGIPIMTLLTNGGLPDPGFATTGGRDAYGNDGGLNASDVHSNILTVANAPAGIFTVAVKARGNAAGVYPDADYTLRIRQIPISNLNFAGEFNNNGLSNTAAGLLLDNQRAFYRVLVPDNVEGRPVLGWELNVSQLSGLATIRARKDLLPNDSFPAGMPATPNAAVIAPPFLTSGTWYVEVRASNSTAFSLVSRPVALQRPAWQMPAVGQPSTTPGLMAPNFADSGLDTNGVPLPGDHGIDLPQGQYHFYVANVPTNNGGLMRVQLDGISGNSDLYMRLGLPPTVSHSTNGSLGTMLDRSLIGTVTEYANWVPLNGKIETMIPPGMWYFGVRAVSSANARYRLRLSTGNVQPLDVFAGQAMDQIVAGGDWRYYRLQLPAELPANWQVSFSQQAGDVVLQLRDTIPPGNGVTINPSDYKNWGTDQKNDGPYNTYDLPGTYGLASPPVRPGAIYYLGFQAKSDAIFSVSSSIAASTNPVLPLIDFYGGSVTNTIPANSQVLYKILTPGDALRWRHTSIHSNTVIIGIENGTLPTKTVFDDFHSTTANSTLDRFLTSYPWLPMLLII